MRPSEKDYAAYYTGYIKNVNDDVLAQLKNQLSETYNLLKSIPEEKESFSYAEGKWSIKELVGHLIDAERIFSYRALAISRGEEQHLPGWDEKTYTVNGEFNKRKLSDLAEELKLLREANLLLFKNFTDDMLKKRGVASTYDVTVLAILFIIAGHEAHHLNILRERYLK
ncbi:MAG TPA: DinB family protein [Ignavibacteriaceae bacterium]|nr:DinB family protein [Ignavibacteriaceae bacterium]